MHAMLLCAGLGTRLRPLTDERPKPLVPVLGRALASYAIDQLAAIGVRHIVANTFHLADQVGPALAPHAAALDVSFETVCETVLLGTGGGIRNALPSLGRESFVVYNGDILAAPDLRTVLEMHRRTGARITLVLRDHPGSDGIGAIEITSDGRVVRVLDDPTGPVEPTRRCMFTGIYVVDPVVAPDLPENGCIIRHTVRRLLARGESVMGFVDTRPWYDVGTVESYVSVNFGLLNGSIRVPGIAVPQRPLIEPNATVASAVTLGHDVIVGAGAQIAGSGRLDRVIVWDGVRAEAPAADCVVGRAVRCEFDRSRGS